MVSELCFRLELDGACRFLEKQKKQRMPDAEVQRGPGLFVVVLEAYISVQSCISVRFQKWRKGCPLAVIPLPTVGNQEGHHCKPQRNDGEGFLRLAWEFYT